MDSQFGLVCQDENNFVNNVQSDGLIASTFIIEPFAMDKENATDQSEKLTIHNKLDEVKLLKQAYIHGDTKYAYYLDGCVQNVVCVSKDECT